jgi:hypothetical protein
VFYPVVLRCVFIELDAVRGCAVGGLRRIAAPFVAAAPAGARVRTRLRVSAQDEAVLRAAGAHLGSLAGRDLAARCAEGRLDARGKGASRAARKRALTGQSSSRWAGAITRTSEDQYRLAGQNLQAERASLWARVARIEARLAVPAGGRSGKTRGYATAAERHAKDIRRRALRARLAGTCCASGRTCPRPGWTKLSGGRSGRRPGGSSPPTGKQARRGGMRRYASTTTRAGWRSSSPRR